MTVHLIVACMLFSYAVQGVAEDEARLDRDVCGRNAFALVAQYCGIDATHSELSRVFRPEEAPYSIASLQAAALHFGLDSIAVSWSDKRRATFPCPSILHVRANRKSKSADHFIACFGSSGNKICFANFPRRPEMAEIDAFSETWDGVAI